MMVRGLLSFLLLAGYGLVAPKETRADAVLIVQGAPGEPAYEAMFAEWSERWESAAAPLHQVFVVCPIDVVEIDSATSSAVESTDGESLTTPLNVIESTFTGLADNPPDRLWIVLVGHGTDDGRSPKFNLDGPDLSAEQLDAWLELIAAPAAVIHCGAASSRFVDYLSQPGRVIITATRSPGEVNFARFGEALSTSLTATEGDFDKDGQTSLLEAFLRASRLTRQFYDGDGRLATEHALIDDNGDGRGTAAEEFADNIHLLQIDPGLDGLAASQWCLTPAAEELWLTPELRARRDALEVSIRSLRARRSEMPEDAYYTELEPLLLEMAELYEQSIGASSDNP